MRKMTKLAQRIFPVIYFFICLNIFTLAVLRPAGADEPRARVVFVGDIMAHQQQIDGARREDGWDFKPQFRRVKPLFDNALVVGNLETVFAGEKQGFAGYPSFNTPDELADALAGLGLNVATLANNHILDRGAAGAARTISVLNDAGILWTGLTSSDEYADNNPLTLEYAGLRWAFVNYGYGSNRALRQSPVSLNAISGAAVTEGLARARLTSPDIVVASFHWGNEYQYAPTKRQRDIAALSLASGADLVIGTHPHVLQPVEVVSSDSGYGLIAYSLGNFVSYQRTLPRERSVILAVDFDRQPEGGARIARVSAAPTRVSATRQSGRHLVEVVYAGESGRFNHAGLPAGELKAARAAGSAALDFLGASASADAEGFYTLWDSASPDVLPVSRRKSPR